MSSFIKMGEDGGSGNSIKALPPAPLFEGIQLKPSQAVRLGGVSLRVAKKNILKDIHCEFKPGTLTLILGPPSSGKTSLLKVGAGYYRPSTCTAVHQKRSLIRNWSGPCLTGKLSFNGKSVDELPIRDLIGFMHQKDILMPTLTVRETLRFALDVKGMPPSSSEQQRQEQEDALLRFLGLTKCADTKLGDATNRGVSGGEQKRVCLGETLAGGYATLFLDEYSTGLDSSATLDITRMLQRLAVEQNIVVVAALLQPPPEVFALFDNLIVLSEGRIIYNGPQAEVLPYFRSIGYICPSYVDVADFLQVVSTPSSEIFRTETAARPNSLLIPRTASEFALAFEKSGIETAPSSSEHVGSAAPDLLSPSSYSRLPWYSSFFLVFQRELKIVWRDKTVVLARLMQAVVMGLVVGTLFFQIAKDQFQTRMNYLWYVATFFVGASLMRIPLAIEFRPVFYRQKSANFFPSWAFSISAVLTQIPLEIMEVSVFTLLYYWLAGLSANAESFFYSILVMFLLASSVNQLMAAVVAFSPNAIVAQAIGVLSVVVLLTFGGFAVGEPFIPTGWLWAFWGTPVSYGFRALAQNEFVRSGDFDVQIQGKTQGERYLETYGIRAESSWQWVDVSVLVGFLFFYTLCTTIGLTWLTYNEERTASSSSTPEEDSQEEELEEKEGGDFGKVKREGETMFEAGDVALSPNNPLPPLKAGDSRVSRLESGLSRAAGASFLDILPFSPATLSWHSLDYSLTIGRGKKSFEKQILNDINGMAKPGRMLALVGASGAGKSTLLDVLARRKNMGKISGDLLVNGKSVSDRKFRIFSAYVEQFDRLSATSTVKESLAFSAALRLPPTLSPEDRESFIESVITVLELGSVRRALGKQLSLSQRKKLSVGVELVANPSILFLDEPTSGLDSRAALNVIKVVKRVAQMGRTIVCTVHQPSSLLFEQFDDLLLLQSGKIAYFGELGPHGSQVIAFLQTIPGTLPYRSGQNPATWMLEVIGAGVKSQELSHSSGAGAGGGERYIEGYKLSELSQENEKELNHIKKDEAEESSTKEVSDTSSSYTVSLLTQTRLLLTRLALLTWRTPETFLSKLATYAFICLVFGTAYANFDYDNVSTTTELIGFFASFFFVGIASWVLSSLADMVTIEGERQLFDKERSSNYYSVISYTAAWGLSVIPLNLIFSLLFTNGLYWTIGYNSDTTAFGWFCVSVFLLMLAGNTVGLLIVSLTPNLKVANLLGGLVFSLSGLFTGMIINYENMTRVWAWIYWLIPVHYFFEAIVISQFNNDTRLVYAPATGEQITIQAFIDYYFSGSFTHDHLTVDVTVLATVSALFIVLFAVVLKFVNHYKR